MEAHLACQNCEHQIDLDLADPIPESVQCSNCQDDNELYDVNRDSLERCVNCGQEDFYRCTRINPTFGLAMVALSFAGFVGLVFWFPGMRGWLLGISVLLGAAVLDRLLRYSLPMVVICYHCKTIYSRAPNTDTFEEHDQEKRAEVETG